METNSNNGGLLPSAIALKDSLNQKPSTSTEQTMLTSYQKELLLQGEREIDERLREDLRPKERIIFDAFHRVRPDFAGCPINWKLGANPPDIICTDDEGKRVGIELVEWLSEEQIKAFKTREKVEESFLETIRSQEIPPPSNIGLIWLSTQSAAPLRQADAEGFRKELRSLIERVNSDWEKNEGSRSPQGYSYQDFSSSPILDQYLGSLRFWPRSQFNTFLGMRWVRFPNHTDAYTPQDAVDALLKVIGKKTSKYRGLHQQESLDELYLLLYYDQGWIYNTPFNAPEFGFREIAEIAARAAANNHGVFQKIFLFNSLYGAQEAVQLWPS